jgi:hypothetical protein
MLFVGKPLAANAPQERDHARSLSGGIHARGYIIGTVQEDALTFGSNPVIHMTSNSVDLEIERLAALYPGTKFVKLRIEGALTVGTVWE